MCSGLHVLSKLTYFLNIRYDWFLRWSTKNFLKVLVRLGQIDKGLIEELKRSEEEIAHKVG